MKSFIANMHMARVKELLWKRYITGYEPATPAETVKLVLKIISRSLKSHRICPAFLYFVTKPINKCLSCGITAVVFFIVYNLFPIKNY